MAIIQGKTPVLSVTSSWRPATLLNRGCNTGDFLLILRNFSEHLFWRTSVNGCFLTGKIYMFWKLGKPGTLGKQYYHKASRNKNRLSVCLGWMSKIRTFGLMQKLLVLLKDEWIPLCTSLRVKISSEFSIHLLAFKSKIGRSHIWKFPYSSLRFLINIFFEGYTFLN